MIFSFSRLLFLGMAGGLMGGLTGCGTTPLYRPYADSGTYGYSEVNVAKNRYEVFYHGPADIDDATAKNFAIVRAAEIGKQNGFTHFRLANSRVRREKSSEVTREPELFPQNPWSPSVLTPEEREQRRWEESRRRQRTRVTVKETPVVQLTVQYRDDDCADCLSVAAKLQEAAQQGILKQTP